jgi:outer membrane receptor protein involved in Fe transport
MKKNNITSTAHLRRAILVVTSCFVLVLSSWQSVFAVEQQRTTDDLFAMSLEELLSVDITIGTLTGSTASKVPFSRTIITAEDIAVTPARSIMDLLEVYVPGATFVNHFNGSRFGFRGILGDQNFHYLLRVNGRNMNLKVEDGPFAEIFNSDLSDIQKIEIIRGPGSATYGPGAIGGVIDITTHTAESSPGSKIGGEINEHYRYQNLHASYGNSLNSGLSYYFSGSYSNSDGEKDTKWYYVDRENGYGYGFMSEDWGNLNSGSPVTHYYGDALDKPQIKLHAGFGYKEFSGWMRYTSGSLYNMHEINHYKDGDNFQSQEWDVFAIGLKNNHAFDDQWHLETIMGFDSFSYRDIGAWQGTAQPQEHIEQYANNYSENEFNFRSIISYAHNDKFKYAAGVEYSYEYYAPRWSEEDDDFLMTMRAPLRFATLTESSGFYQRYAPVFATQINAPHIQTYSLLMEANMEFHKYLQLILSGRADKNELSTWAYSPRIALVTEITDYDIFKAVWQRSVRIPNMPELYVADYMNSPSPEHEILENYEIMYAHTKNNFSSNLSLYYNILDEIQWTIMNSSDVVGELKMWGIEAEFQYQKEDWLLGANYSYIRQDSWKWLDSSVIPHQNLSDDAGGSLFIPEYAENRINNFPSNTIKMYWNKKWFSSFSTHMNARVSWDQNQKELLQDFLNAHNTDGTTETQAEMQAIYKDMTNHGYGEPSFTLNISGTWKLPIETEATLTFYAMNLISYNHIRYNIQYYEGLHQEYSRQSSFINEPVSVGVKLEIAF